MSDQPWNLWFGEVKAHQSGLKLGFNNLLGRTPDSFTTAQTTGIVCGPESLRGARIQCNWDMLLGYLLKGMEESDLIGSLLQARISHALLKRVYSN